VDIEAGRARYCDGGWREVNPDQVKVVLSPQSRQILTVAAPDIEPARFRRQSFGHAVSDRHNRLGFADEPTYSRERSRATSNAGDANFLNRLVRRILAGRVEQRQIIDNDSWVLKDESAGAADVSVDARCSVQTVTRDRVGAMDVPTTKRAIGRLGSRRARGENSHSGAIMPRRAAKRALHEPSSHRGARRLAAA
jgi:hypothetical protein